MAMGNIAAARPVSPAHLPDFRFMKRLLLLACCSVLTLAAHAQPVRIVVLGSSTAEGVGSSPRDSSWVNRYTAHIKGLNPEHSVVNLGRGGYTTYHIRPTGTSVPAGRPAPDTQRNITRALQFEPDAIIVNMPSNDATSGYSLAEQLASYDLVLAAAGDIPVWIATTQPRNLSATGRANLMAMRDSTFARFGSRALDFWTAIAQADGTIAPAYNSGDGIHLNNAGHRLLFQRVVAADLVSAILATSTAPEAPASTVDVSAVPNPFRAASRLSFTLTAPGPVTLRVYDTLGREVARLVDGALPSGTHEATFEAAHLPAGVYLYHFQRAEGTTTGPLVLVR